MNIFVTGGTGFIGSHLVNRLKRENHVIILMRDLSSGMWGKWLNEALVGGCTIIQGDLSNQSLLRRILAEYNIEQVYHLASQAIVSIAIKDPVGTFQTNVMGTINLLDACRQVEKVQKILVMSTDKVYADSINAHEKDPLIYSGIYETSKVCQDHIAQAYCITYNMHIQVARACNCFGYDLNNRIIPNTVRSCLKGEPPIIYEGEKTQRQYIFIDDLVSALHFLMVTGHTDLVFNIGTDDILSQEEVVKRICLNFPLSPRRVKREKPLMEIYSQSVDWSNLKKLGWKPKFKFDDAIRETIKRFQTYGF